MNNLQVSKNDSFIAYSAEATIYAKKKDKILWKQIFKNSGRWPLFYYLAECLAGNAKSAAKYLPKYIDLFHAGDAGQPVPVISDNAPIGSGNNIADYANEDNRQTLVTYTYASAPVVIKNENVIGDASVTLKFMIPFTHISQDESINLLCLYSDDNINQAEPDYTNPCAFFFIGDENGDLSALFNADDRQKTKNDYNVFIEWKLTISNRQNSSTDAQTLNTYSE